MSRKLVLILGVVMVFMVILTGCSSINASPTTNPGEIKAALGQEFTLPVGQTASIDSEKLMIKFETVTTDSRCPSGVQCVWAGEAKCQMQVTLNGAGSTVVLTESGGTNGFSQGTISNYKIDFQLTPYPKAGTPVAATEYKLLAKITK